MKAILNIMAICAMLASFASQAVCPVQGTTIFYLNGLSNGPESTGKTSDLLKEKVLADPRVRGDCLEFTPAFHSSDELYSTGFFENGLRISEEITGSVQAFWENVLRLKAPDSWFNNEVEALFVRINDAIVAGQHIDDAQVNASLAKFREEINVRGRQEVLVAHSDGNNYASSVFGLLTPFEKTNTHLVAVATPLPTVADGGPYVVLEEDRFLLTTTAPLANASMLGQHCADIILGIPSPWLCHGFKEAYMLGTDPKGKIIADIVAALPTAPPPSGVRYLRLITGNPGVPGDGILANTGGILGNFGFELQPHFSLQGITNGITVSVFPPNGTPIQNLFVQVNFTAENNRECTGGGRDIITPLSINGVAGIGASLSQNFLNGVISDIRTLPGCVGATIDNLRVSGVFVAHGTTVADVVLVRQLDAIAIGIGENVFPTRDTPAP